MSGAEAVCLDVDGERFVVEPGAAFVFGRGDRTGVVGLDPNDMGISGRAGSLEWKWNVWWVTNVSTKRPLLLEVKAGGRPTVLEPGGHHAITTSTVTVLVPGAIFTHRIVVSVPRSYAGDLRQSASRTTTGTLPVDGPQLSSTDRDVLAALCEGYLASFA